MGRHQLRDKRSIWQSLLDGGFILVIIVLLGLIGMIIGLAIGLRFL